MCLELLHLEDLDGLGDLHNLGDLQDLGDLNKSVTNRCTTTLVFLFFGVMFSLEL